MEEQHVRLHAAPSAEWGGEAYAALRRCVASGGARAEVEHALLASGAMLRARRRPKPELSPRLLDRMKLLRDLRLQQLVRLQH